MYKKLIFLMALLLGIPNLLFADRSTRALKGAFWGGVTGAAIGGIAGGGYGAGIGAAVGVGTGALIGASTGEDDTNAVAVVTSNNKQVTRLKNKKKNLEYQLARAKKKTNPSATKIERLESKIQAFNEEIKGLEKTNTQVVKMSK